MTDREKAEQTLVQSHFATDPAITRIFRLSAEQQRRIEPLRLLLVNEETTPGGIVPLGFDANPAIGIGLPLVIIEITPDEFGQLQEGKLELPDGWQIEEELHREPVPADS